MAATGVPVRTQFRDQQRAPRKGEPACENMFCGRAAAFTCEKTGAKLCSDQCQEEYSLLEGVEIKSSTKDAIVQEPTATHPDEAASEDDDTPVVERREEQRRPADGEPICVVPGCGKYGAYVCDATEKDVCSLECKAEHLRLVAVAEDEGEPVIVAPPAWMNTPGARAGHIVADDARDEDWAARIRRENEIRVEGPDVPLPIQVFSDVMNDSQVLNNLSMTGLQFPTAVQMQVIPIAVAGRDVLAMAPTGSGKTVAFLLPIIHRILTLRDEVPLGSSIGLVLAPTRELCAQSETTFKALVQGVQYARSALLVGGVALPTQVYRLRNGVQCIMATPGRLIEILGSGHGLGDLLAHVSICVLDEVDRMLDVGFGDQVNSILIALPRHQTLMLSATMDQAAETLARKATRNPLRVQVGKANAARASVKHTVLWVENKKKKDTLKTLLTDPRFHRPPLVVFVAAQMGADLLAEFITKGIGMDARPIHGGKTQDVRQSTLNGFLAGEFPVLVSTNVTGRGIDMSGVAQVINFDFPATMEEYVHRAGRAAAALGWVVSFVNEDAAKALPQLIESLRSSDADAVLPTRLKAYENANGGAAAGGRSGVKKRKRNTSSAKPNKRVPL